MLKIIANRKVNPETIMITQNLNVLFRFENEPLLYWGQTRKGTLVIGTTVEQDGDLETNRHLHVKVSLPELENFLAGRIALYNIFKYYNKKIYVVDTKDDKTNTAYECEFNGIPEDYIPQVDSFCPENSYTSKRVTKNGIAFDELLKLNAMTSYREINKLPQEKKKIAQKMLKIGRKLKYEHAMYCAKNNIKVEE